MQNLNDSILNIPFRYGEMVIQRVKEAIDSCWAKYKAFRVIFIAVFIFSIFAVSIYAFMVFRFFFIWSFFVFFRFMWQRTIGLSQLGLEGSIGGCRWL